MTVASMVAGKAVLMEVYWVVTKVVEMVERLVS